MFYDYENTNTGKNQKVCREVREESVEAIKTTTFFSEILSMIP